MEWYSILSLLLGAFGGVTGFISLYHAPSKKDTIDIGNLSAMLEEARKERELMKKEHEEMTKEMQEHIEYMKRELEDITERERKHIADIYQAYRCPLYNNKAQCPVLSSYDDEDCEHCTDKKCLNSK